MGCWPHKIPDLFGVKVKRYQKVSSIRIVHKITPGVLPGKFGIQFYVMFESYLLKSYDLLKGWPPHLRCSFKVYAVSLSFKVQISTLTHLPSPLWTPILQNYRGLKMHCGTTYEKKLQTFWHFNLFKTVQFCRKKDSLHNDNPVNSAWAHV